MGDREALELLKIAKGCLPRVRLEYDRVKYEIELCKAEFNLWKAEISNAVRTYQDFSDRTLALRKREDDLQRSINNLQAKKAELQKATAELQQQLAGLHDKNAYNSDLNLQIEQEDVIFTNDVFVPIPHMSGNYRQNENEMYAASEVSRIIYLDVHKVFNFFL